jgi:hypothetical protein
LEAADSKVDEKVLGRSDDIQNMAQDVSEYCLKYHVLDDKTNLPPYSPYFMAKEFLDLHAVKLNSTRQP